MRLRAFEFEDADGQGIGGAIIPVDDLTVMIGRNGVGKSLLLDAMDAVLAMTESLDRGTRGSDPPVPYGWIHVTVDVSDGPHNDWSWLRPLLVRGLPGEWGSEIPNIASVLGGPQLFDDEDDYENYLYHYDLTQDEDESWRQFRTRAWTELVLLHPGLPTHLSPAIVQMALGGEAIDLCLQLFPGGDIQLVLDTSGATTAAVVSSAIAAQMTGCDEPECLDRTIAERLADPSVARVHLLRIGQLPEDEASLRPLLDRLPATVRIGDRVHNPENEIDRVVDTMVPGRRRTSWLMKSEDGGNHVRPEVHIALERIAAAANDSCPSFVRASGGIAIRLTDVGNWSNDDARSIAGKLLESGEFVGFDMLGAGTRRWVSESLRAACRDLATASSSASDAARRESAVYLIDEPEMHLHATAQRDVLRWIEDRVATGHPAVVATHSPIFLDSSRELGAQIALARLEGRMTQVDITGQALEVLGATDGLAEVLGMDRATALQITRGFLVVEGEHDVQVIDRFWGKAIASARIQVLALRGTQNALSLISSQLVGALGIPMCVMFDDVRQQALGMGSGDDPPATLTPEEKKMRKLLEAVDHQIAAGHEMTAVEFPLPDVIAAIPLTAVRSAFPDADLDVTWDEIISAWRANPAADTGFKPYALRRLSLKGVSADEFVTRSLACVTDADSPAVELTQAVKTAIARLAHR